MSFETTRLSADVGLMMAVYTAEPGSPNDDALNPPGKWAATLDQAAIARAIDAPCPAGQSPLAESGSGTGIAGYATMVLPRLGCARTSDRVFRREKVLEPVTK